MLLEDVEKALTLLKFNPYKSGGRNIELGRQEEVERFFEIVKPRNIKHYRFTAGVANVVTARV